MSRQWWHGWRLPKGDRWTVERPAPIGERGHIVLPTFAMLKSALTAILPEWLLFLPIMIGGLSLSTPGVPSVLPQSTLGPFIGAFNVRAFGAKADGSNDTPAFVAAELQARALGGNIAVPAGVYTLGATGASSATAILTLFAGEQLVGTGQFGSQLLLANGANRSVVEFNSAAQGVAVRDIRIEGNSANQVGTSHGIHMLGTGGYGDLRNFIENVFIHDVLTDGIIQDLQASECSFNWVLIRNTGRHGFNLSGSDNFFINCQVNNATLDGFHCLVGFQHFVQCATFACGQYGAFVGPAATHCNFYNSDIDSSGFHNVYIQASQCSFQNGISRDPGQAVTATYSHVALDPALDGVRVTGCDFKAQTHANTALFDIQIGGANGLTATVIGPNSYETGSFAVAPIFAAGSFGLRSVFVQSPKITVLAYGPVVTLDLSLLANGDEFDLTANNGVAFNVTATVANIPANNLLFTLRIANTSGGALGAITWGGMFKQAGVVAPANGFSRIFTFQVIGAQTLRLVSMSPADIPN